MKDDSKMSITSNESSFINNPASSNNVNNEIIEKLMRNIGSNTQKVSQNVTQMNILVQHIGTINDSDKSRDSLLQLENYTNQIAKDANQQLKNLHSSLKSTNNKVLKLQKDRLTNELMKTLKTFQDLQKLSMKKQFEANDKAKKKVQELDNNESILNTNYVDNRVTFESNLTQAQSLDNDLIKIEERDNALKKLEHDMNDINVIFKDLAVMVHDQGDIVNSIEANIETTQSRIQISNQNLESAVKNQNKARRKKILFFSIMALIIMAIIIIVVLSLKPWKKN